MQVASGYQLVHINPGCNFWYIGSFSPLKVFPIESRSPCVGLLYSLCGGPWDRLALAIARLAGRARANTQRASYCTCSLGSPEVCWKLCIGFCLWSALSFIFLPSYFSSRVVKWDRAGFGCQLAASCFELYRDFSRSLQSPPLESDECCWRSEISGYAVVGEFQPLEDSRVLSLLDSASQALCERDSQWGLGWGLSFFISHKLTGHAILVLSPHRCHGNKTLGPHWFPSTCYKKKSQVRIM